MRGANGVPGVKVAVFVVELYEITPGRSPMRLLTVIAPTRVAGSTSRVKVTVMMLPKGTSVALSVGVVETTPKERRDSVVKLAIDPIADPVALEAAKR